MCVCAVAVHAAVEEGGLADSRGSQWVETMGRAGAEMPSEPNSSEYVCLKCMSLLDVPLPLLCCTTQGFPLGMCLCMVLQLKLMLTDSILVPQPSKGCCVFEYTVTLKPAS